MYDVRSFVTSEEGTYMPTISGEPQSVGTRIEFSTKSPHLILNNGDKAIFPFSPPILQTSVPDDIRELMLSEGKKLTRIEDDMNFELAGNLKFGRSYKYKEQFRSEIETFIISKAMPLFEMGAEIFGAPIPESPRLGEIWINFSEQFDFNPPHIHSRDISFVIYVDVPPRIFTVQADSIAPHAGKIMFEYGEYISPYINNSFDVEPYNGLMFLFPAKLRHYVPSFWVDEQRISVAGNISLI